MQTLQKIKFVTVTGMTTFIVNNTIENSSGKVEMTITKHERPGVVPTELDKQFLVDGIIQFTRKRVQELLDSREVIIQL